jgi:hypothetical protein
MLMVLLSLGDAGLGGWLWCGVDADGDGKGQVEVTSRRGQSIAASKADL